MVTNAAEKAKAEGGVILHRVARQGLPEKRTSEHRLEKGEWMSHVALGAATPAERYKGPGAGYFRNTREASAAGGLEYKL